MGKLRKTIKRVTANHEFKSFATAFFVFLINIAFLTYNLIFGILYKTVWNLSISMYYALLVLFRVVILSREKKWNKAKIDNLGQKRESLFKGLCWCLIIMDFSLIAPITLMSLSKRAVNVGMIPTIAIACYTTYKITLAIVNYCKWRSKGNLSIKALRLITLKDAVLSIVTLQNTMIMVFGDSQSMQTFTAISSAGFLAVLIGITISAIISAYKKKDIPF